MRFVEEKTYDVSCDGVFSVSSNADFIALTHNSDILFLDQYGRIITSAKRQAPKPLYLPPQGEFLFWPDQNHLLFVGDISYHGGRLTIVNWNPHQGTFSYPFDNLLTVSGYDFEENTDLHFSLSKNGKYLAINFNKLVILDLNEEKCVSDESGIHYPFALSPSGEMVVGRTSHGTRVINWQTEKKYNIDTSWFVDISLDATSVVGSVVNRFATIDPVGSGARIWETKNGKEIARIKSNGDRITSLSFTPSGNYLYAGESNGYLSIWSTGSYSCMHKEKVSSSAIQGIKVTSLERRIIIRTNSTLKKYILEKE